jgi:uncharacterized protein (DUF1800 family)
MGTDPGPLWTGPPAAAWAPYDPGADGAWDEARAAHLQRRGGFGAAASLGGQAAESGAALHHILEGEAVGPDGRSRAEFDDVCGAMAESAQREATIGRVRLYWILRLLYSPHPLQERMTLAWHGHYATGARKVDDPRAMLEQNEALRRLWDAPISQLHRAMLDSSALQVWLDGVNSDKESPNENLAREFLELFALGEGAYGEADVKAAARALTGYRYGDREVLSNPVVFNPRWHDGGAKTLLGATGRWGPADLVQIASGHPAAARAVARRLFITFVDDVAPPPPPLVDALADLVRTPGDVDVARGIRIVLGSRLLHAEATRARRVKSPVEFAVGLIRTSGWYRPAPDAVAIDNHMARMGQTLLDPPSVAGWPGGYAWLGAPLLVARANFVAEITSDPRVARQLPERAAQQGCASPAAWARAVGTAFIPGALDLRRARSPVDHVDALRLVASLPEAHLA